MVFHKKGVKTKGLIPNWTLFTQAPEADSQKMLRVPFRLMPSRRFDRGACRRNLTANLSPEGQREMTFPKLRPRLCATIADIRQARRALARESTVGFVPTMGALHEGHAELFRRARSECDVVIGSVFVNPAQFAPHEDLDQYPRQLEQDLDLLETEGLADLVFAPKPNEMYSSSHRMYVDPVGFDDLPEGVTRPGFFRGVATVVTKLFNIVQSDRVYFGQKDALQCVLINRLVEDMNIPVDVVVVETKREADGLAISSRNVYMSPAERAAAPAVYQALNAAAEVRKHAIKEGREAFRMELVEAAEAVLAAEPLIVSVDYLSIGCPVTMEELDVVGKAGAIVSIAVRLASVRLIDNVVLPPTEEELAARGKRVVE